jgi:hypothetical protein
MACYDQSGVTLAPATEVELSSNQLPLRQIPSQRQIKRLRLYLPSCQFLYHSYSKESEVVVMREEN